MKAQMKIALLLLLPAISLAQVPVDEDGNVIGEYQSDADVPLLSEAELQDLVGPIALYPDDLLAIVLPASAYPLQIVEAARFLEAYENDSSLEPDPDWDDSVVALTNYPEVIELLNEDLDWTLRLGEAVVAQQADVVSAVESFRDRAYAAGNLKSDEYQTVVETDGVIHISPAEDDAIYVPYYEPERVVYHQPRPVYYYHPRAYPVYYYPYSAGHRFSRGYFWGVTTAFTIGWNSHSLHTYHHSYNGHPYYGRSYWNHWYRRPSIQVYNSYYTRSYRNSGRHRYHGDRWNVRKQRREYVRREGYSRSDRRRDGQPRSRRRQADTIVFRDRSDRRSSTERVARSRSEARDQNRDRNNARNRGNVRTRADNTERRSNTRRNNTNRSDARSRDETAVARNRSTTQRQARSQSRENRSRETADRRESRRSNTQRRDARQQRSQARPVESRRQQTQGQRPAAVPRATVPRAATPRANRRQEPAQQRRESAPTRQRRAPESRQRPTRQESRQQPARQESRQQQSRSSERSSRRSESRNRSRVSKR